MNIVFLLYASEKFRGLLLLLLKYIWFAFLDGLNSFFIYQTKNTSGFVSGVNNQKSRIVQEFLEKCLQCIIYSFFVIFLAFGYTNTDILSSNLTAFCLSFISDFIYRYVIRIVTRNSQTLYLSFIYSFFPPYQTNLAFYDDLPGVAFQNSLEIKLKMREEEEDMQNLPLSVCALSIIHVIEKKVRWIVANTKYRSGKDGDFTTQREKSAFLQVLGYRVHW